MRILSRLALAASVALGLGMTLPAAPAFADTPLRIASPYPTTTLDPSRSAAAGNIEVFGQLYARVLHRSAETEELEPGLAEAWEVSPDRLTYTLHLRDAKFSDGSPISADDVVFSFERVRSDAESALPSTFGFVESFAAPDARTVVIKLKARWCRCSTRWRCGTPASSPRRTWKSAVWTARSRPFPSPPAPIR